MIGQCLSNKNESATVSKTKNFLELNKTLLFNYGLCWKDSSNYRWTEFIKIQKVPKNESNPKKLFRTMTLRFESACRGSVSASRRCGCCAASAAVRPHPILTRIRIGNLPDPEAIALLFEQQQRQLHWWYGLWRSLAMPRARHGPLLTAARGGRRRRDPTPGPGGGQ